MLPFRTIKEIKNLKGKRVLLGLDLNVPVLGGLVRDDFRIRRVLQTIEYLKKRKARIVIVSHRSEAGASLKPIALYLNRFTRIGFIPDIVGAKARSAAASMPEGGAILLENLRLNAGEKKNSPAFAKKLASMADIFVNDAFSNSHRKHASISGVPKILPSFAGLLFTEEYNNLSRALRPKKPLVLILGGSKLSTKIPLVKCYLSIAKTIFVGGELSDVFFSTRGYRIAKSSKGKLISGLRILFSKKNVIFPSDVLLSSGKIIPPVSFSKNDRIVDIGPSTIGDLKNIIIDAKTIVFNGPVGIYEEGFASGTEGILKLLAKSKAETIVGGGDTVALITKLKMENKFTFVSTGGGAMLEFLATGTLPGIKALGKTNNK